MLFSKVDPSLLIKPEREINLFIDPYTPPPSSLTFSGGHADDVKILLMILDNPPPVINGWVIFYTTRL